MPGALDPNNVDILALASSDATRATIRRFLFTGGGILTLSLVFNTAKEFYSSFRGGEPDYWTPIGRVVLFTMLLGAYSVFTSTTIGVVRSFGTFRSANVQIEKHFAERFENFALYVEKVHAASGMLGMLSPRSLEQSVVHSVVTLSFVFTRALIYVLKHLQVFLLNTVIHFGPILLGFASLGGLFAPLALAWFWALIEVTAWGVTMQILVISFANVPIITPEVPDLWAELIINFIYAMCILSVPVITSSMIRSQPIAAIGQAGVAAIASAHTAARMQGMLKAGLGGASKAGNYVRGVAGPPMRNAAGRAVDAARDLAKRVSDSRPRRGD